MLPLPEHWSAVETHTDVVEIEGVEVRRAGLSSVGPGGEATGSAAELFADPAPRARFELLERIGILEARASLASHHLVLDASGASKGTIGREEIFLESEAPDTWRHARSNGIAIHTSWQAACLHAKAELVERDRVLRSWAGSARPVPLAFEREHVLLGQGQSYTWSAFAFPAPAGAFGDDLEVVGVFGFPVRDELPVAVGYCAKRRLADALTGALREATQMLAFLWGESVPTVVPELAPTAMFHLDALQVPERRVLLQRWLSGAHVAYRTENGQNRASRPAVRYVDLSPSWMAGECRIAKAMCDEAMQLVFGRGPFLANLPAELQIHPIA